MAAVLAIGALPALALAQQKAPDADALQAGPVVLPSADPGLSPIAPIIPDDEFNAAVPVLGAQDDPELDRPLEALDAFEQRVAAAQPATAVPTVQPGHDTQLSEPLPPLESFRLEPTTMVDAAVDPRTLELGYQLRIDGLASADEQAASDLAGEFNRLSALRQGKGRAANIAQLNSRLGEDALLVRKLLAAEGWFDADVITRVDRSPTPDGQPLVAVIVVAPGRRFALSGITIVADPTTPPDLIQRNFDLANGQPVIAERVIAAEAQVALALPQNGYPFAELGQRDIVLDPQTGGAAYTLPVSVGARSRYGRIVSEGRQAFGADHVAVLARFKPGELYDSRQVDDLRQALVATGLFSAVAVEPRHSGEMTGDGAEAVTIAVKQEAGPPRVLAATGGYGTGEGLHAEVSWTHRNLFPPEGALIVSGRVGTLEQGGGVTFRRANAGRRDRTFELAADLHHSDYDAFSAYTGRLGALVSYGSTPLWQKRLGYSYGAQVLGTNESVFDPARGARTRRTYAIAGLTGEVKLDTTDTLLDPTSGMRVALLAEPEGSVHNGFSPYVRLRLDGSAYQHLAPDLVVAGRLRIAAIQGVALDDLAPSRRLYAGGGGSVRGFGYQGLGPRDLNGDPTGGRSLNEGALELRYRFGDYGVAAFADVGQVYHSATPDFSNLRVGVGLGARIYTNFGPVRIDLATPLHRRKTDSRINVYVSIGQAF
jgi:translocation and assembly module TamA